MIVFLSFFFLNVSVTQKYQLNTHNKMAEPAKLIWKTSRGAKEGQLSQIKKNYVTF